MNKMKLDDEKSNQKERKLLLAQKEIPK